MPVVTPESTRLLDRFSLPVMALDRDERFVYANAAYLNATHSTLDGLLGRKVFDCFPESQERVESVQALFRKTLDEGVVTQLEAQPFQLTHEDGSVHEVFWQAVQDPLHDADGRIVGLLQRAENITHQVELQRRNEAIGHELNHRVKNIMAVVSAIARITGRNAGDVGEFVRNFTARLSAMSRTNDKLAHGEWRGLTVGEVMEGELYAYKHEQGRSYTLSGPKVRLSLEATKDLSLVIHEMATNAAKYGCLGDENGALAVRWTRKADILNIRWEESCSEGVAEPDGDVGFGTRLLEMLPSITVERDFRPTGLHLNITVSGKDAFA